MNTIIWVASVLIIMGLLFTLNSYAQRMRWRKLSRQSPFGDRILRVQKIIRETDTAITLQLEDSMATPLLFSPGQYLTLKCQVDNRVLWRSYSFSSLPGEHLPVRVTIKKKPGGLVSNWIHHSVQVGDKFTARGPAGRFIVPAFSKTPKRIVFIAGGSGITPIYAMIQALLMVYKKTALHLIYGNNTHNDIIFAEQLSSLEAESQGRLSIVHVLNEAPKDWAGQTGVLDEHKCASLLSNTRLSGFKETDAYFICGPLPMMQAARSALQKQGVPDLLIHEEHFTPDIRVGINEDTVKEAVGSHPVTFRIAGWEKTLMVSSGRTLLETGLAAQLPLPFSCMSGDCGTCRIRICRGRVKMPANSCLSRDDRLQGYILACVAKPVEAVTVEA